MATQPVPAEVSAWRTALRRMPASVWALGFTSMFMDMSSELVHSLLPVFMSTVLGTSMLTIGIVEGIAEATASITKVFSGVLSDRWNKRKSLVVFGYGLSAFTKPIFPLASSIGWVAGARFMDRVGKGIRGAPRDALIADITPAEIRGAAYGLRQAMDSVGAVLGPMFAVGCMLLFANNIQSVLWVGVVPGMIAVALLIGGVKEPDQVGSGSAKRIRMADLKELPSGYWLIVGLGAIFTLARFSEAFLILRGQQAGMPLAYLPVVFIVMNVVYTAGAYPAGVASDKMSHTALLLSGVAVLIAADLVLATAGGPASVLVGVALWGVHLALTQGLFSKLVADFAPADLRGTAFGVFNLISGVALLGGSVIAGGLWNYYGAPATFYVGAAFAAATAVGMGVYSTLCRRA